MIEDINKQMARLNIGEVLTGAFKDTANGTTDVQTKAATTQAKADTADMGCGGKKSKIRDAELYSDSDENAELPKEVVESVREQVGSYLKSQGNFQAILEEYINARQQAQDNEVHENFVCDGCDMTPIKGIRYMCTVRNNYDLCQNCERNDSLRIHPMLKIRKSKQAPARIMC